MAARKPKGLLTKPEYTARGMAYQQVETARRDQWSLAPEVSSDWELMTNLPVLRQLSKMLVKNSADFAGMLAVAVNNTVGSQGFGLQARTGDRALNDLLERVWKAWSRQPEVTGRLTWADLMYQVAHNVAMDGDCLVVKTDEGRLQVLEGAQFAEQRVMGTLQNGNKMALGVEVTPAGRPVRYHIREFVNGMLQHTTRALPAEACMHLAHFIFTSQSRGLPAGVQGLAEMHRLRDVKDSNAAAWVILSRIAMTLVKKNAAEWIEANSGAKRDPLDEDLSQRVQDLDNGTTIFVAEEGEEIRPVDQNRPGMQFGESLKAYMRATALVLGMPLEVATMDFGSMNYSSAKAAQNQALVSFQRRQQLLEHQLCRPTYEWVVMRWCMENGHEELMDRPDLLAHEWIKPAPAWLDPLKEVQALGEEMNLGLKTHAEVLKSRGQERAEWLERRMQEFVDAIEAEERILQRTGRQDVRGIWRVLAGLQQSEGAQTVAMETAIVTPEATEEPARPEPVEAGRVAQ